MTASSRRERVYQRLAADLTLARDQGHPDVSDTRRMSSLTGVLVDWLRHVQDRSGFTNDREVDQLRLDLCRSLATTGTHDTAAVEVLIDQFHLQPPASNAVLTKAAQALRHLATRYHHDELSELAADRSLGACRSGILVWLAEHGQTENLHLIAAQIDDPSVRATAIACLRHFRPTPTELISTVEHYLYDPDRAVRHQASRTVAVLYVAVFAANSRAI
ncbi:hypothetical protein [Gordonia sp. NPDC058843]|uniref:hypothetical protein n=1 Tax=Gordonia sp. NPDC058843 TaxID=3346648 RepID=UPI00367F4DD4